MARRSHFGFGLDVVAPALGVLVLPASLLPLTASLFAVWSLGFSAHCGRHAVFDAYRG